MPKHQHHGFTLSTPNAFPPTWRAQERGGALEIEPQSETFNLLGVFFLAFSLVGFGLLLHISDKGLSFFALHRDLFTTEWLPRLFLTAFLGGAAVVGSHQLLQRMILRITAREIQIMTSYVFWRTSRTFRDGTIQLELGFETEPSDIWYWTINICPVGAEPILIAHESDVTKESIKLAHSITAELSRRSGFERIIIPKEKARPHISDTSD